MGGIPISKMPMPESKPKRSASPAPKLFKNRAAWRAWLEKNHDKQTELWLVYYKKGSGKKSVTYEEALQEALCFGWIDSIINALDAERYMQRWTPRNIKSIWSAANKARIRKLIAEGRMAPPGLDKIKIAKKNGSWTKLGDIERIGRGGGPPPDVLAAISSYPGLQEKLASLSPSRRKILSYWVASAKRPETRDRRIRQLESHIDAGTLPGAPAPQPRLPRK
jgi:uncharacterized protein YdeI (YjbR/CyaY-like superfamily)